MNEDLLDARLQLLRAKADLLRTEKFRLFTPYDPQMDFFRLSATKREILFMAGTQLGKTEAGAFATSCHLTGVYPDWWPGLRFKHPVAGWAGGEGGLLVRDVLQRKLCGKPGSPVDFGTGMIPKHLIIGRTLSHGVTNAFDNILVKHASGGTSSLGFKSYDQGREKWQSETLDFVWEDEEPPSDIHDEALARLTGGGIVYTTCTPLKGETQFIRRYTRPESPEQAIDRGVARMGLKHVSHFTEEEKAKRLAGYDIRFRAARANGDPVLEAGAIFCTPADDLKFELRSLLDIPLYWPRIWGIDFGFTHPFAAALCAHDRDGDVFYVLKVLRMRGTVPVVQADAIKGIAINVPVAWPHDGTHTEKSTGEALAQIYRALKLNMLAEHATHDKVGGYHVWPGLTQMDVAMRKGKFKVASTCTEFFEEYNTYRTDENGEIVKIDDDVLDAVRCAWMMRRRARPVPFGGKVMAKAPRNLVLPGADTEHWGY